MNCRRTEAKEKTLHKKIVWNIGRFLWEHLHFLEYLERDLKGAETQNYF